MTKILHAAKTYLNVEKKDTYRDFAFTIKARKREDCKSTNYLLIFDLWRRLFDVVIVYAISEKDKLGRLHYHGMIKLKVGIKYKQLIEKSMSCWFRQLINENDKVAWRQYCRKDLFYRKIEKEKLELSSSSINSCNSTSRDHSAIPRGDGEPRFTVSTPRECPDGSYEIVIEKVVT